MKNQLIEGFINESYNFSRNNIKNMFMKGLILFFMYFKMVIFKKKLFFKDLEKN